MQSIAQSPHRGKESNPATLPPAALPLKRHCKQRHSEHKTEAQKCIQIHSRTPFRFTTHTIHDCQACRRTPASPITWFGEFPMRNEEEDAGAGRDERAPTAVVPQPDRSRAEGTLAPPPTRTETPAAAGTRPEVVGESYAAQQEPPPAAGKPQRLPPLQPPIHAAAAADSHSLQSLNRSRKIATGRPKFKWVQPEWCHFARFQVRIYLQGYEYFGYFQGGGG
jgi:hypothetical protein